MIAALSVFCDSLAERAQCVAPRFSVGFGIHSKSIRRGTAGDKEVSMSTFTKLVYHIVFATKWRSPLITEELQTRLYEYLGGIIRGKSGHLVEVGGVADHIHLLVHLSPKFAVSDVVREVKGSSSAWVNSEKLLQQHFEWQKGYGAFTVSYSASDSVQNYICNQEEHHRHRTFEEEYIEFLERHQIKFERRYLFEDEHHG
jgi:REP element-mobilizing transposase RayT